VLVYLHAFDQDTSLSRGLRIVSTITMSTRTGSITQTQSVRRGRLGLPVEVFATEKSQDPPSLYQVDEHEPATTPVPLDSPLAIATHISTWVCWALYFVARLPSDGQSTTRWFWLMYFCETAFMLQDFQAAFELTFSLFGPRKFFRHAQYSLKGTQAPIVTVFIT
jgi:hypothetical protein